MEDKHGNEVALGDIVRVTEICPEFLALLPDDEHPHIAAMLGQEYPIDDFPEEGKASVSIEWVLEDAEGPVHRSGGLHMLSGEFELARQAGGGAS